jgi:hypothetical protein
MKVYVVHRGEYSDRDCVGVFSTREKAEAHIAGDPRYQIETYEVDELPAEHWFKDYFYVRVGPNGEYEEWESHRGHRAPPDFRGDATPQHSRWDVEEYDTFIAGSTVSYEHAKKLAVECMQKELRKKVDYESKYQERMKQQEKEDAEYTAKYSEDVARLVSNGEVHENQ